MKRAGASTFFVDEGLYAQTKEVLMTRAAPRGIELVFGDYRSFTFTPGVFGAIVQYPAADGEARDYREFTARAHANGSLVAVAADLMSLALLTPPGEWDADVVVGSAQRFGLPMNYGGPHAGYLATRAEFKRNVSGRIIGVTVDAQGRPALRLALQSREQHIKREKASSNICTAKALNATMAGFYAAYHGMEGLQRIARHIHAAAVTLAREIARYGYVPRHGVFFDTLRFALPAGVTTEALREAAQARGMNFYHAPGEVGLSTDEKITAGELNAIVEVFAVAAGKRAEPVEFVEDSKV
jgi:glycine dehydrogenase